MGGKEADNGHTGASGKPESSAALVAMVVWHRTLANGNGARSAGPVGAVYGKLRAEHERGVRCNS